MRLLALQGKRYPDVDMAFALQQIAGWQTARKKIPSWAAIEGIVYPPHLSMEQCSSEQTARYKAGIVSRCGGTEVRGYEKCDEGMTVLAFPVGADLWFSYLAPRTSYHEVLHLETIPALYLAVCSDEHCSIDRWGG